MDYTQRASGVLNTHLAVYRGSGPYDIPYMRPEHHVNVEGLEPAGFNYFLGEKHPEDKILHFFVNDYQFERVWKNPDRYVEKICRFGVVIAPDFSMYTDHPRALQIFNHYRKQWCARYWQDHGATVVPCINWSDQESFEWCFDGVPKRAAVCVSTVGSFGNHEDNRARWLAGYKRCLDILQPSQIIIYGKEYPETDCDCQIQVIQNTQMEKKKVLSVKRRSR